MKNKITLGIVLLCQILLLGACDRLKLDRSQLAIQIPQNIGDNSAASLSDLKLHHLVVQVTASDMTETILLIQDAQDSTAIAEEVSIDIPSGADRLIQVLAVYSPAGSDQNSTFFYGDISKTLSGGTVTATIPMTVLGNETGEEESHLMGRYLTSNDSGPSGELKMVYKPIGKPAMIVDKKPMFAGWFEATLFQNVPMNYQLPDGTLLGEGWTQSSLVTSATLVRSYTPATQRQEWGMNQMNWVAEGSRNHYVGFLAKDPNFLTDKKVCVRGTTLLNAGTLYAGSNYLTQNSKDPLPLKFFANGTTPQFSSSYGTIAGGSEIAACNSLPKTDEFKKFLRVLNGNSDNRVYDRFESAAGLSGLNAKLSLNNQGAGFPEYRQISADGGDATGPYMQFRLLPGVAPLLKSYQVFRRPNTMGMMYNDADRCETSRMTQQGWTYIRTNILPVGTDSIKIRSSDLGFTPDPNSNYTLCLEKDNQLVGNQIPLWSYVFNNTPASQIELSSNSLIGAGLDPVTNECRSIQVHLRAGNDIGYNPYASLAVTVEATNMSGGAPLTVLYADSTCSTTANSTLTKIFSASSNSTELFIKSPSPVDVQVAITTLSESLTINGNLNLYISDPPSTADQLRFGLDVSPYINDYLYAVYLNGCTPVKLAAWSNTNQLAVTSGSVSLTWTKTDGVTTYAPPSGFQLVNNCLARTPIGSPPTMSGGLSTFGIVLANTPIENAILKVSSLGFTKEMTLNLRPLVDHFVFVLPGGSVANPSLGTCQALEIQSRDSANNPQIVPAGQNAQFNIYSQAVDIYSPNPPDVRFYTDASCVNESNGPFNILAGASVSTVYMKANNTTSGYLTYYSEVATKTASGESDLINRLLISPTP